MIEDYLNFDWSLPKYSRSYLDYIAVCRCFAKADGIEIEDVDYIDVTHWAITDPARLLTEYSMTPFWVEDRRREKIHNRVMGLGIDVYGLMDAFEELLYAPCTPDNPRPNWEHSLNWTVIRAFYALRDEVRAAFARFEKAACVTSWDLWDCHGLNDEEYTEACALNDQECKLSYIRFAFDRDLCRLTHGVDFNEDDFPF